VSKYRSANRQCTHCGQLGHNVRTCSILRKDVVEDPNGWAAIRLRRVVNNSSTVRSCSHCKISGHNKSTCMKLKMDRIESIRLNREFRKATIQLFHHYGIGICCMLELNPYYGSYELVIVENIVWENIIHKNYLPSIMFCGSNGVRNPYYDLPVDSEFFNKLEAGTQIKIIEPAPSHIIESGMPTKWLDGKSGFDRYF